MTDFDIAVITERRKRLGRVMTVQDQAAVDYWTRYMRINMEGQVAYETAILRAMIDRSLAGPLINPIPAQIPPN